LSSPQVDGGHSRDAAEPKDNAPGEIQVEDALVLNLVLEAADNNEGDDGTRENSETLQGLRQMRLLSI